MKFTCEIGNNLRQQLAAKRADELTLRRIDDGYLRGVAVLEYPYIDIEVNVCLGCCENEQSIHADYYICVRDETQWESWGYAEEALGIGNEEAKVEWLADNWEEQLKADMVDRLTQICSATGLRMYEPNNISDTPIVRYRNG